MDSRTPNLLLPLFFTCLLHFLPCARGQSSYIIDSVGLAILPSTTVESGTPVSIRCQVSVSHDNIPDLTHTFQLRRDHILVHSSTTADDSVVYKLSPARAADSGNYECRVSVKDKSKTSFGQKLDVTGLQTPVLYLNKTTLYDNEEFIAICSAPEEKGSLIFRFYQRFTSGEFQMIKQPAAIENSSETTLVLRQAGDSFLYCDYKINLVSGPRRSNRSIEIRVMVKGLYISPIMNVLPSSNVFEGDIVEVVCKVVTQLNDIEVYLTREKRILKQAPHSLSHRFKAQEENSGELVCKAVWGNVQKETYHKITVKELFSKPQLTVDTEDIAEGDKFKLSCSVSIYVPERINNETMRFSIYRDNVKLTNRDTYISVANPSTNGNYTCKVQALSLTPSFVKESKTVAIKAKVPVSKPVLSVVGGTLVLGKPFKLLCHSDIGTLPIVYTLYSPNKMQEKRVLSKPGEEAIFNVSAVYKSSDINNFLCHAKNSQYRIAISETGHLLRLTNIIEPVSKPVLRILPSVVSEGQDVTLMCFVQRGTLPISFTWYHIETKGALASQTSKTLEGSYTITNVGGEHQGKYFCESTNLANETKLSQTVTIGVRLAVWKKGLIAAFCILLILAFILVLIFKRRVPRLKRKTAADLSVKSASTKVERLSLTQTEVNEAANATPGIMGKSVWSGHVSGSDSDDQNSVTSPEKPEPQDTEVQTKQADPNRVKKGTDTLYSEVRSSRQGAPEPAPADGQGSVEYAQLNHDADHHGDHGVQDGHTDETESNADNTDPRDCQQNPVPDC